MCARRIKVLQFLFFVGKYQLALRGVVLFFHTLTHPLPGAIPLDLIDFLSTMHTDASIFFDIPRSPPDLPAAMSLSRKLVGKSAPEHHYYRSRKSPPRGIQLVSISPLPK